MHLWPSMRLRDSFKIGYLKKLEWNLHRMNVEKKQQSQSGTSQQKLLDNDDKVKDVAVDATVKSKEHFALVLCRDLLMIFSCCYCCFCCGAVSMKLASHGVD